MPIGVKGFQKGHVLSEDARRKISESKTRRIYFNCDYCGSVSHDKPSHFARKKRHFCSNECYSKFRSELLPKEEHPRYGSGDDEETKSLKRRARSDLNHAIRDGIVKRKPCEICGIIKSEAHHTDYSKPLDVRWLCFEHHRMAHSNPHLLEATNE